MRHLRRLYQRPDGGISITQPAWDDRFSPFGPSMAPVRALYAGVADEVRRLTPGAPRAMQDRAIAQTRERIRGSHAAWVALFPFDPFTVTEQDYYTWAVTKETPAGWTSLGDCDAADLPQDREFRNQWRHDGQKVAVDPVLEVAERWRRIRVDRDKRLLASDAMLARAVDLDEGVDAWKTYRQALRDVPLQPDPKNIIWPVEPAR